MDFGSLAQFLPMLMSGQSQQNAMLNAQTAGFGDAGKQATLGAMQYANPSDMSQMDIVNRGMQNFANPGPSPLMGIGNALTTMGQQNKQQPMQVPPMQRMPAPQIGNLASAQLPQAPMGMGGFTPEMMQRLMMMQGGRRF